ncbi:hypothetical protein [Orientia tsutsugamushi]|uniref:hypothetical protein n=1 Tax=Orientia tsutsugamushi TaxID=784 RepID=UPI0007E34673|nr:hypothetical protein [Orientia tsutsugamushi]
MPSKKKNLKKKDRLYTFNQYLDNKDNLGTKSLEAHPCSKKFLSQFFQYSERYNTYSNKNFDKFVDNLDLDNLEKLLQPARLIEPPSITSMICNHCRVKLDVLADTLKELTSNIDILKNLYNLHIPFSTISGKHRRMGSDAPGHLKNIFEDFKLKMKNWPGNTYEEICKRRAYVLNSLKKAKLKSYDINSSNYDVDNDITNQTTIKQNPFDLYIANNNKLEGYSWSMKLFLREIFQKSWAGTYSNEDFDGLISSIQLDNLEKLLSPARIIEPFNITAMLINHNKLNIRALKKTLKVLTLNINILEALYGLGIPFSTISGKLHAAGSKAADLLTEIFKSLVEMIKVHKNNEENLISFDVSEQTSASVKDKYQKDLPNIINSAFKKINSQEQNNLTINNHQSQTIDRHREDDIETNSDEINTHSDSQKLDISDSELEAIRHMDEMILLNSKSDYANQSQQIENYIDLYLEDCDLAKNSDEINTHSDSQKLDISDSELEAIRHMDEMILLNSKSDCANQSRQIENYIDLYLEDCDLAKNSDEINTHSDSQKLDISDSELEAIYHMDEMILLNSKSGYANQSQQIEGYQENNIENLQIIRETYTEEVMQSVKKRKSCYDEHEDLYTRKRQCNNPELNSDYDTEVALNEQDSINVDCATSVTSYLVGESICILSNTAGYSAYILE